MRWLFYLAKAYAIPVARPLALQAQAHGVDHGFFVSDKVAARLPQDWLGRPVFTRLDEVQAFAPDFVLCPGNFVDFRLPGIKVQLFHGIGVEKPSHYQIRHFFDLYLTSGPVVTERYEAMRRRHGYFGVVETGWPKMDEVMGFGATGLRDRFDIPAGKKVVLYAPTHSRRMQSAEALLPVLPSVMQADEVWFCKPHELTDKTLLAELAALGSDRFRLVDDYDITSYLHLADVMVSDTSSVLYEFMALDKPVVTYRTLSRKDKGIDIAEPVDLRQALDRCFAQPAEFGPQRRRHLAEVNPRLDGTIAATVYDVLANIDPTKPLGRRRKPLNLFRKAQVLYHSRMRQGYLR